MIEIKGWMSDAELAWLGEQAAQMNSVVEIGCHQGRSSKALLDACQGTVYCIDVWNDEEQYGYVGERDYQAFLRNVGHYPNLRAQHATSLLAAEHLPDVDMVFIDGDHEYESVKADIKAWLPKTRKLLCGHDYGVFDGVTRAVDERFGSDWVSVVPDTWIWQVEVAWLPG